MKEYDDIINMPHYVSKKHPQMEKQNRAAQFAPFAALAGYSDAVKETARLTDNKIELGEEMKAIINEKLSLIDTHIKNKPLVTFTYFVPDKRKNGGTYENTTGNVRQIDIFNGIITLMDKRKINISRLIDILEIKER